MARDLQLVQEAEDRIGGFSELVDHLTYAIQEIEGLGVESEFEADVLRDVLSKAKEQVDEYEKIMAEEAEADVEYLNSEYLAGVL